MHEGLSSDTESYLSFQNTILVVYMLEALLVFGSSVCVF